MNIVEIIKKAPKDHVYYCTVIGECRCELYEDNLSYPINCFLAGSKEYDAGVSLTSEGMLYASEECSGSECVLFPSRDNRDWEAFERELEGTKEAMQYVPASENGVLSGYYQVVGMTEINLDHGYYKEFPYIDFQIDGKKYRVSTEDIKRLAMDNADNKTEHIFGQSFDRTAEIVSIPDRPMMAAVIMSGMLAGGFKDSAGVLANKAVHYADIILKHTEEERDDKGTDSK